MSSHFVMLYNDAEHGHPDWRGVVFEHVAEALRYRGERVTVRIQGTFDLETRRLWRRSRQLELRDSLALLQEEASRAFWVLDCHDWVDPDDLELLAADPRCQRILKCQFHDDAFGGRLAHLLTPWTYFECHWPLHQDRLESLRRRRRTCDALHFRGHLWEERVPVVQKLQGDGVLNADHRSVPFEHYLEEVCSHRLVLSMSGMGELCHRDIECFGFGTPVLRPRLPNRLWDDLEPDHHYIAVDTHIEKDPPAQAAERIAARHREVVGDHELLRFIAENAADWYDRNVRLPASMDLTARLLELPD